jgi:hypothetical protein
MGNRGQIRIEQFQDNPPVYLYGHWLADRLPEILADALGHEERWADPEYLTRIIAEQMAEECRDFTGMGIGTAKHGDVWRVITVDPDEQEVRFEDTGDKFGNDTRAGDTYDFERFVKRFTDHTENDRVNTR